MFSPLKDICRLCGRQAKVPIGVFSPEGEARMLERKIRMCLPITVSAEDQMPKQVCISCCDKLETSYNLYLTCNSAQTTIKRLLRLKMSMDSSPAPKTCYINERDSPEKNSANHFSTNMSLSQITVDTIPPLSEFSPVGQIRARSPEAMPPISAYQPVGQIRALSLETTPPIPAYQSVGQIRLISSEQVGSVDSKARILLNNDIGPSEPTPPAAPLAGSPAATPARSSAKSPARLLAAPPTESTAVPPVVSPTASPAESPATKRSKTNNGVVAEVACKYCGKMFGEDIITLHQNLHLRVKFFTCVGCDKNFTTEVGLNNHRCAS